MKLALSAVFLATWLLVEVTGHHGGGRFGGHGGGFGGGRRGGPPSLFPACKELMDAVFQKCRDNVASNCSGLDRAMCKFEDLLKAREEVTVAPSVECLSQVEMFFSGGGDIKTTEEYVTTTAPVTDSVTE